MKIHKRVGLDVHSDTTLIAVSESERNRGTLTGAKRSHHFARVYDDLVGEYLARFIEDARVMPAILDVQSYRQVFCIHKAEGL